MNCILPRSWRFLFFQMVLITNICFGQDAGHTKGRTFKVNDFNGEQSLGTYIDIYEDPGKMLTFEDILRLKNEEWTASETYNPNMGYTSSTYWFRISIQFDEKAISKGESYLLEVGNPRLDTLDFYEEKNEKYSRKELGSTKPFSVREVEYIHPVIKLNPSNKRMTYYFKVNSVLSVVVPVILITQETLHNRRANEGLFYGIYFGILLIMTFYNLVIFFSTGDKTFLYYVLYIALFMLANFALLGYAFQYLWPDNTFWAQRCTMFFFVMSTGAAMQFGRKFLDLKNNQPVADEIAKWSYRMILLYGVFYLLFYSVLLSYFSTLLTLFTCIFLLYTGIVAAFKKYRPAYYYLIAWTAFLLAIIILVLMSQGVIPTNSFTRNAIYFASALE
ncbi:MAG: hypothetical protein OEY51_05915, partial [Cyclobacteriaceae bacterium]|nr:hypothetical protein [Cyclobacteriaceae bacterium]